MIGASAQISIRWFGALSHGRFQLGHGDGASSQGDDGVTPPTDATRGSQPTGDAAIDDETLKAAAAALATTQPRPP
jgi:hypothetical protein